MTPGLIIPIIEFGKVLLDKFVSDPQEKAKAEYELMKLLQEGQLKVILAQLEINAREAQHASVFVSGWRPWIGWMCGFGLFYSTFMHNIFEWIAIIKGWPTPPAVDTETLVYVLGALLGVGIMRTVEKVKKVAK